MCGIIGAFNLDWNPATPDEAVRAGMQTMITRGPDGDGIFRQPGVVLGHRRLAIIDIESGAQPMTDPATGATLVFNGKIYNFQKIRRQLEHKGHVFATNSDTEVLLHACLEWGYGCLDHLSGMFAFAVFDPRDQSLFLARDRIGIKPLFYAVKSSTLYFASTIPALRCFPAVSNVINPAGISHYLTSIRTSFGRQTLFRDIQTLLPGEFMPARRDNAAPTIRRYWDYPIVKPADKPDPGVETASREIAGMLKSAVREQLISDVPVGGFLSGGLDSCIISGLARQFGKFDAYSVGYDLPGFNEWDFIRDAARHYGMECREEHLSEKNYADDWQHLICAKGLPLSTPNETSIYRLARALRHDFTVALSGEGADEIFGGYQKAYFSAYDYERARHTPPERGALLTELDKAMTRLYRRPYFLCRADHFFLSSSWIPFKMKYDLLHPEIWNGLEADRELFAYYDDWFEQLADCSTFDAYMHIHARINLEGLLSRVDSSTMTAGVEARVPFTDHRLADYVFTLPDNYKIRWRDPDSEALAQNMNIEEIDRADLLESKLLLRRAFGNAVPETILRRPKMSFPTPTLDWLNTSLHPLAEQAIAESDLAESFFQPRRLRHLLKTAEYNPSAMALWPIVNLCLWQTHTGARMP